MGGSDAQRCATPLQGVLFWKKQGEVALQRSGIDYTIVRPGEACQCCANVAGLYAVLELHLVVWGMRYTIVRPGRPPSSCVVCAR